MRILALMPLAILAACSRADGSANSVDVTAAASRAEDDIANYAALRQRPLAVVAPRPTPGATPSSGATPAADEGSDAAAAGVVRRYVSLIAAHDYPAAWALWGDHGKRSGLSVDAFAASFARYASFTATVGAPTDPDAGAGQRYVTVPVHATGTLVGGGKFVLDGPIVMHRVADGIESDDPDAHRWRIDRSDLKPRPIEAQ